MSQLSRHTVIIHPATAEEGQEEARVFVSSEVQSLRQSEAEERLIIASVLGHFLAICASHLTQHTDVESHFGAIL